MRTLLCIGSLLVLSLTVYALDEAAQYQQWMKAVGAACGGVKKGINASDPKVVADNAKQLQELFAKVQSYWTNNKCDDAVTSAKEATAAFNTTSELAVAGKWDEAAASFKKATANCGNCHTGHREKAADGTFKIK